MREAPHSILECLQDVLDPGCKSGTGFRSAKRHTVLKRNPKKVANGKVSKKEIRAPKDPKMGFAFPLDFALCPPKNSLKPKYTPISAILQDLLDSSGTFIAVAKAETQRAGLAPLLVWGKGPVVPLLLSFPLVGGLDWRFGS